MAWQIDFDSNAAKQFSMLDKVVKNRIDQFITERLTNHQNPIAISEPMKGKFSGSRRFRVGDYRLICDINADEKTIVVYQVGHRRNIYE